MTERGLLLKSVFWSAARHIVIDAVVVGSFAVVSYLVQYIVRHTVSVDNWIVGFLRRLDYVTILACITLLLLSSIAEISFETYRLAKNLGSTWLQTAQFKWTAATEALFSYVVGVFGLAVVYGLLSRAETTANTVASGMIYAAAFVLFCEIAYMVAMKVRERVLLPAGAPDVA